jgi:hypothetical protein
VNCRYTPQAERKALWEKAWGVIPDGQTIGSKCHVKYCGDLEHMMLVDNKTFGHQKVKHLVVQLEAKKPGEYIEIPPPENIAKFRAALYGGAHRMHIVTRMMPSGLLRLINNGEHCVRDYDLTRETYLKYPQVIHRRIGSTGRPWQSPVFEIFYARCRYKACPYPPGRDGLCKKHLAEEQWEASPVGSTTKRCMEAL